MKGLLLCLAIIFGQVNSLQDKPVIRLPSNSRGIDPAYGGKRLELINAPTRLSLPAKVPKVDALGKPWLIDIKNLGPATVAVVWKTEFNVPVMAGQTVHISANGTTYTQQH